MEYAKAPQAEKSQKPQAGRAMMGAECIALEQKELGGLVRLDWEAAKKEYAGFILGAAKAYGEKRQREGKGAWMVAQKDIDDALTFFLSRLKESGFAVVDGTILMAQTLKTKKRNCETSCRLCADFLSELGMPRKDMALAVYHIRQNPDPMIDHVVLYVRASNIYYDLNKEHALMGIRPEDFRKADAPYVEKWLDSASSLDYQLICETLNDKASRAVKLLDKAALEKKGVDPAQAELLRTALNAGIVLSARALKMAPGDWSIGILAANFQKFAARLSAAYGDNAASQAHDKKQLELLDAMLAGNPDMAVARLMRANLHYQYRRYEDALADYKNAYSHLRDGYEKKGEIAARIRELEILLGKPVKVK